MKIEIQAVVNNIVKLVDSVGAGVHFVGVKCDGESLEVMGIGDITTFKTTFELKGKLREFDVVFTATELIKIKYFLKSFRVTDIKATRGGNGLDITGYIGKAEDTPEVTRTLKGVDARQEGIYKDQVKILGGLVDKILERGKICDTRDTLAKWLPLAKCGEVIHISDELVASASTQMGGYYEPQGEYSNLEGDLEILHMYATVPGKVNIVQSVCKLESMEFRVDSTGTRYIASTEDKRTYVISGGTPMKIDGKNIYEGTLERLKKRYEDIKEFDSVEIPYSVCKDVMHTAVELEEVNIKTEEGTEGEDLLIVESGVKSEVKIETEEFVCNSELNGEQVGLVMKTMPIAEVVDLGVGVSQGMDYMSFKSGEVTLVITVLDRTEV